MKIRLSGTVQVQSKFELFIPGVRIGVSVTLGAIRTGHWEWSSSST